MPSMTVRCVALPALVAFATVVFAGRGLAQEVKVGVAYSAPELVLGNSHAPEQGTSVTAEYLFKPIKALRFMGSPRIYLGGVATLDGYTNFAQAGLSWRFQRGRAYVDLGGGLAIHDGELELPKPEPGLSDEENARRRQVRDERSEFVYRELLHASLAFGWRLNDSLAVELSGQHWSNGHLGNTGNDGTDIIGVRLAYRH